MRGYYRETPSEPFLQTINVLALAFNLVPPAHRSELQARLVHDVLVTRSGHEEVGVVGAAWILPVLSQAAAEGVPDAAQAAYEIATQTTYPSYGYWSTTLGWTGLGEKWESDARSESHAMFGSIGWWLYADLAGLQAASPGYGEITFEPTIPSGLSEAAATENSVRGEIDASWQVNGSTLVMHELVPPNATGLVYVPASDPSSVTTSPGATYVGRQGARLVYEISSGTFTFTVSGFSAS